MKVNSQTLAGIAAACIFLGVLWFTSCRGDERSIYIGKWKVAAEGSGQSASDFDLLADVREDGTFTLTGNRIFQAVAGMREIHGTYSLPSENKIHVEMETKAWDYQPTTYAVMPISDDELVFNAEEYAVTLRRVE